MPDTQEIRNQAGMAQLGLGEQTSTDEQNLPQEVQGILDQFEEGSRQIFIAAFKSAHEDGMDVQSAMEVAWNTVKHDYQQGDDGKWRRRPQQENLTNKSIQSGGN